MAAEREFLGYCTSKAAVNNFTRPVSSRWIALARVCGADAVCPGWIDTAFSDPILTTGTQEVADAVRSVVPLGARGRRRQVCVAVAFLCSDEASYITGHALVVDGGIDDRVTPRPGCAAGLRVCHMAQPAGVTTIDIDQELRSRFGSSSFGGLTSARRPCWHDREHVATCQHGLHRLALTRPKLLEAKPAAQLLIDVDGRHAHGSQCGRRAGPHRASRPRSYTIVIAPSTTSACPVM